MIGYTLFGTNDLEKAKVFYDGLFSVIGVKRGMEMGSMCAWGEYGGPPMFGVTTPHNGQSATAGNGTMIALEADSRAKVDALHAKALALGGSCEGPAGLRGDEGDSAFYAAYFRDPDGNKLCAFRIGGAHTKSH
jgi:catechol 2,3-dioxygenase-like lactoylglutathione lyase family enzyme